MTEEPLTSRAAVAYSVLEITAHGLRLSRRIAEITGDEALSGNTAVAVLSRLWLDGALRPGDLANTTGLTSGGTTRVIDRLQEALLVTRDSSGLADGRGVLVELTPKGREVTSAIFDAIGPLLHHMVDDMKKLDVDPTR